MATSNGASSAVYGGVYRAVCLEVLSDRARIQVPQLFAAETVTVYEFAGPRPAAGDEGWVSFESQQANRPIWVGSESKGGFGGGGLAFATDLIGTSPEVVTHNLGTRDLTVTVYDGVSPYAALEVDWEATDENTVTLRYAVNLAGYRVVILGKVGGIVAAGPPGQEGPEGPEGPVGDPGPPGLGLPAGGTAGQVLVKDTSTDYDTSWQTPAAGGGAIAYRYIQVSAATVWTIEHGLGFYPNVMVVDSTKREIWPGTVDYLTATSVQLTFSASVAGE